VGDLESRDVVKVDEWFAAIGRSFLEPEAAAPSGKCPVASA
jgi:hypothetical protein